MGYFNDLGVDYTKFFTDMTEEEREAFSQRIADNLKKRTPSSTPRTPKYIDGKPNPEWKEQQQKKYEDKKKEAEEIRDNAHAETLEMFSDLDEIRSESVVSFNSKYSSLNLDDKKKYLYHLYNSDKLNKEEYKNQVNNLFTEKFNELSKEGVYEGYVPYEHNGQTFLAPAQFFNPDNTRKLDGREVASMSILPNDSFYFPDSRIGTEKEWLSGKVTEYGQTITSWQNPNYHMSATLEGKGDETASSRARELLLPDKTFGERLGTVLAPAGIITGNPIVSALSAGLQGADLKDIAKTVAIGQITAPILENTVANLGVDADLFGIEPEAFSEGMMDVQTTILEGGDIDKALIKEFGVDAVKQLGSALPDVDIDLPESQFFSDLGDALEPVVGAVRAGGRAIDDAVLQPIKTGLEPVVDVAQQGIDVLQQAGRDFDDTFIDPIDDVIDAFGSEVVDPTLQTLGEVGQDIIDPIDAFIDAIDSPLGDLLGAGGDLLGGILSGQGQQQQRTASTPTEGLFDKELFKFDTEIKSTQEMLSPMMNLRKYG